MVLVSSAGAERNAKVKKIKGELVGCVHVWMRKWTLGGGATSARCPGDPTNDDNPSPPKNKLNTTITTAIKNQQVETEAERCAEISIVQLNPGGILNWKYKVRTDVETLCLYVGLIDD